MQSEYLIDACDEAQRGNITPCSTPRAMLNGSDNMLSPLGCLMRMVPVAAAKAAWMMRLTLTLTPASARALSSNEGNNYVSSFTEHHSDKSLHPPSGVATRVGLMGGFQKSQM